MPHGQPSCLPFPPEFHVLRCGAKTRAGTSCKRRDLYASGRCRLHGGLSTGPKRKRTP
ncbi:HGGxSTG domain-containing protein [Pseudomonas veronii]|uniref:HGGxSTG domain-containing protein n=1 Tax=Pseudomonas veronii TaxID=76761 RepID=UPI0034E963AC